MVFEVDHVQVTIEALLVGTEGMVYEFVFCMRVRLCSGIVRYVFRGWRYTYVQGSELPTVEI